MKEAFALGGDFSNESGSGLGKCFRKEVLSNCCKFYTNVNQGIFNYLPPPDNRKWLFSIINSNGFLMVWEPKKIGDFFGTSPLYFWLVWQPPGLYKLFRIGLGHSPCAGNVWRMFRMTKNHFAKHLSTLHHILQWTGGAKKIPDFGAIKKTLLNTSRGNAWV